MKTTFLMIFLLFGTVTVFTANAQSSSHEAAPEWAAFRKADDSLQHVYNHVQEEYSSNQDFIRQLKKSQALWKEMRDADRSEEHTSELQSLMRISYAVFCLKKKKKTKKKK